EVYNSRLSVINTIIKLLKDLYFKVLYFFNLPVIYPIFPTNKFQYDFVLNNGLVLGFKKYICYIEYIGSLVNFNDKILNSRLSIKIIRRLLLSKRCKYVFFWSKAAKKILINFFNIPNNKVSKFKTIYPTIEPKKVFAKENKKTRLLFISSVAHFDKEFNFYMKGGKLILQAFNELNSRLNNIKLTFIGYVPPKFKKTFKNNQNIEFFLKLPYDQILKLYETSDIFLFPTYADSFGFTFLEAMSYGLPIICLNNNSAAPELVINNKTGFVLETSQEFLYFPFSKYCPDWITKKKYYLNLRKKDDLVGLKNLIEKLEILIQNKELREKFGKSGRERIVNGKLSLEYRNKKLFKLFNDSYTDFRCS
ncbi:MAG: glycosyltransferase family 4 protein, partial [Promethearchaeota archaeon]